MSLWTWLAKVWHAFKVSVAPMVVGILELLQGGEDSGLFNGLSKIIDDATGSKVASDINAKLKAILPNAIAALLGVEGLPANPTDDQIKDFEQKILNAVISKKAQQSVPGQVISALGVQIYDIIKKLVAEHADGSAITAAQITNAVEEVFQDLQADKAAAQDPNQ